MVDTDSGELSQKILSFHQTNYKKAQTHQVISDPKSSYFQYSRYYSILKELSILNFKTFMDIGCAEGMYLSGVKKHRSDIEVYGIDYSSEAMKKALKYTKRSVDFLLSADVTRLPFADSCIDTILCSETLEHVVNDRLAFKEIARICRKYCIITVPSFNNIHSKTNFKPDFECKSDSHLRKYTQEELYDILKPYFKEVSIYHLSLWYLSSVDVIIHMFAPKKFSACFSHLLSSLARVDYSLSKAGAHGHSYMCICRR